MKNLKLMNFFGKLKLWQKLALIIVLLGVFTPLVTTWPLIEAKSKDINFGQKEIYGTEYLPATSKLYEQVAKHRHLVYGALQGNNGQRDALGANEQAVNAAFQSLSQMDAKAVAGTTYGAMFGTVDRVNALKRDWDAVKGKSQNATNPQEALEAHNRLMTAIYDLIGQAGDTSNLILDPDLDTYYLMDVVIVTLPEVMDALEQTRTLMTGALSSKTLSPEAQTKLNFEMARAQSALKKLEISYRKAFEANTNVGGDLPSKQQSMVTEAIRDARTILKRAEGFSATAGNGEQVTAESNKVMDRLFSLYDATNTNLAELLHKRVNNLRSSRNWTLAAVFALLLVSFVITYLIVRGINAQVSSLSYLVKQIELGNTETRAEIVTQDELGTLANSFNVTLDNTRGLLQSKAERDSIQRSIMRLLDEVSTVAEGDLTRHAAVTEDITGAIADSFNFMIDELRRIIGQVKTVSSQVANTAVSTQDSTTELVQKAEVQSQQIMKTTRALEEMTSSIQEVSQGAVLSASVAQESLVNARQGAKAVQDTIKGMNRIREQVQETSSSIKRLGESSQEIGEIVQLIDEIADQTAILALNASIQAATAGEAGRGFAVVAEEIEQLAERSSQATAKITSLVKSIQLGTNEAITAMEDNTREVVEGSKLALQAGQSLTEIETVSARLAELIQTISQASQKQTQSSETLSQAMTDISQIVTETTSGIQQSAVTVKSLSSLADDLRTSVASFKLPGGNR